ncbi:unnamed protein product [Penicillium salamii]|uniref:Uncharacterized protein n=1 Tax=Penicillium salamii TaxID=1612424 RepID=A0A9W4K0A3_9EURO|nr:unnamed protein product [Penicillium salamii]CAG8388577.1 unnamed protein product [Penicillium salamii]CAG8425356.1 unnamed protein product [Penicillium salamii]
MTFLYQCELELTLLTKEASTPRVLRLRNSSFHSARLCLLLIAVSLELCHGLSQFFFIPFIFISHLHCPVSAL